MADVTLHHCSCTWLRVPGHPCATVRSALDDRGIAYDLVTHPLFPRSRRTELEARTGQRLLPVIELADGTIIREESAELARRIRAGGPLAPRP